MTERWGDDMKVEIMNSNSQYVDITPFIAWQGLSIKRQDVDGPDAGRTMDGRMHRDRVAIKDKLTIKTVPLTISQMSDIQELLYPETVTVRINPHPLTGGVAVLEMYSNNVDTTYVIHRDDGDDLQSLSFPLVEV